ncbi:MAG: hypothetical protein ACYTF8_18220 [Planctomycetota bacterium]|jgi:hypothetical protein
MRYLVLAALVAACGNEPAPVSPVTLKRRPGRPGERIAVRIEHKRINQVSPHQAVEMSKQGNYVDEVQATARVLRSGTFGDEEIRSELTRRERSLVDDRGARQDVFEQFEGLLPARPVRPGDRWQVRDFWGTWGHTFPAPAPKLKSVRASCVYMGRKDQIATIHVELLAETVKGPWALDGDLSYDLAAEMLVRVQLHGTGDDLGQVVTAERELLR